MLDKLFKERLSLTLVVVVAGLATALIRGNGLLALAASLVFVLLIGVVATMKQDKFPAKPDGSSTRRRAGDPFSFNYVWKVEKQVDAHEIAAMLVPLGLEPDLKASPDSLVLKRGSQLHTRLFGGYFVDPKRLPVKVEVVVGSGDDGQQPSVQLKVLDTLGVAIRDKGLEGRYARAAAGIRDAFEASMKGNSCRMLPIR